MSRQIRISASRLKTLWDCSLKFWYQEIMMMPDESHWKTKVGSLTHLVFECVMHPKREEMFKKIVTSQRFVVSDYPALVRFIKWQLHKFGINELSSVDEIQSLLDVAFFGIRPYFTKLENETLVYSPPKQFFNEKRFQITLPGGAVISGFIDLLVILENGTYLVIDLKTQGSKFVKADLPSNIQAAIYQAAIYDEFKTIPAVEFIMLRHAPTKKTPDKHLQRVEPIDLETLEGLIVYIEEIYKRVNNMGLEEAYSHICQDDGYCKFLCGFLRPSKYWIIADEKDKIGINPKSSHFSFDKAQKECKIGEIILEREHKGCAMRWTQN